MSEGRLVDAFHWLAALLVFFIGVWGGRHIAPPPSHWSWRVAHLSLMHHAPSRLAPWYAGRYDYDGPSWNRCFIEEQQRQGCVADVEAWLPCHERIKCECKKRHGWATR